jgi:2'-5' RNA ligase
MPVWATVDIPGIERLHATLADLQAPEAKAREHGFSPHMTLAFLDEGDPLPEPLPPVAVTFTELSVHRGDDVERFPFGDPNLETP